MNEFEKALIADIRSFAEVYATPGEAQIVNFLLNEWENDGLVGMAKTILAMKQFGDRMRKEKG